MITLSDEARSPLRLTYEQVAEELRRRLYRKDGEPDPTDEGRGSFLTLTYDQLYQLSGYQALHRSFYAGVESHGWEIGIIIGFGVHGVSVATDDHFAADGWSSSSWERRYDC